MSNYCKYNTCDGSGLIEVDPAGPHEAYAPQQIPCECIMDEADELTDYEEDRAYDDFEDRENNY